MKKFSYILAAIVAVGLAAPSIASAETIVVKRSGHYMGSRAEFRDHGRHYGRHHDRDRKVVIIKKRGHHWD